MALRVKTYKVRGANVLMFHEGKFLLLPSKEVKLGEKSIDVSEEALGAALDVTPTLPLRVLQSAWRNQVIFSNEVTMSWASAVARAVPGLSVTSVIAAYK